MKKLKQGYFGSNDLLFQLIKLRCREKLTQSDFKPVAQLFLTGTVPGFWLSPFTMRLPLYDTKDSSKTVKSQPLSKNHIILLISTWLCSSLCKSAIAGNGLIDGHCARSDKVTCQSQLYDRIIR